MQNIEHFYTDKKRHTSLFALIKTAFVMWIYVSTEILAILTLDTSPDVFEGEEKRIFVTVNNSYFLNHDCPHNLNFRWWLADGFTLVSGPKTAILPHRNAHNDGEVSVEFTLKAGENIAATNKCVLEISSEGRFTALYIPLVFLG